jgi:hypothetical protein
MSIGVQSFPELYTTLLGWDLYDKLWMLLTQTGIAYVPFIGLIFKQIYSSYLHAERGAEHGLRSMEVSLVTMMLIVFFAASPCIPLDVRAVSYSPTCGSDKGSAYHAGDTGTTYDKAFSLPSGDIRVPILWYAVMAISEGLTTSANTMVACVPDLRKMVTEVNMTRISDPQLKAQIQDFETMCYAPARAQFFLDNREKNSENLGVIKSNVDKYGVDDTEWMGSHAFLNTYYKSLKATRPVPPFPYMTSDDLNSDNHTVTPPAYGMPTCADWWGNASNGLQNDIYKSLPPTFDKTFHDYLNDKSRDQILKNILSNGGGDYHGYDNANNMLSSMGLSAMASSLGILMHQAEEYPKIYAASQAAPIIQALLLLLSYVFLPFVLVFTSYQPSTIVTASIFIFSLIFWAFIWHLVSFVDQALIKALYASWFSQQGAGATLTDMIIGGLVLGAPLFWFMYMGSMGVAIGNAVSSAVMGMSKVGDKAAVKGANQSKAVASSAIKSI